MAEVELRFRAGDEARIRRTRDRARGELRQALDLLLTSSPPAARYSGVTRGMARKRGQALGQRLAEACGVPTPVVFRCDDDG